MVNLFLECNEAYIRDMLINLKSKGISLDYIATLFPEIYQEPQIIDHFKDTQFLHELDYHLIIRAIHLNENSPWSLTDEDILKNTELEKLFLTISDRLCFFPKSVQLRQQHYYELLNFWKHFLIEKQITHVIYQRVPHLGYGNIIYQLAHQLGIPTIIIRDTLIDNTSIIDFRFEESDQVPSSFLSHLSFSQLINKLPKKWQGLVDSKTKLMLLNVTDNTSVLKQNQSNFLASIIDWKTIKAVLSLVHRPWGQYYPSVFYMEWQHSWAFYYWSLVLYYLRNRQWIRHYAQLAHQVDLDQPFIYLALHYQPERTSLPEGGVFENQLLMVDILAKSLPVGWKLYVKEHPYQFARSDNRKMNLRNKWYYDKIATTPNVELVSIDTPSSLLLAKCEVAVTLTGTTGWEALTQGKPVITFTKSAWYYPCRSCFYVHSQASMQIALQGIRQKTKENVKSDVIRFLLYYAQQRRWVESVTEYFSVIRSNIPRKKLITNLTTALIPYFK